tara:strand:+ start:3711 stop:4544 length:834 start_codon:yes stop_codon:yes gene_type:complete
MKIGLIGNGFVGNAVYENLKRTYPFCVYDKNPAKANVDNVRDVCHNAKIIFVALPTPMESNGRCDLSIIFGVMSEIACWYDDNIVILKSTVPPGTCERIKKIHPKLRLVFSPEFLTEANYIEDFKNCNRMIFGGDIEDTSECVKALSAVFPDKSYLMTDLRAAEMVKYFINTFLAVKVSFANEMKQICDTVGLDYDDVKRLALYDTRIGKSHLMVPGPDGNLGFGGTCFPKDINALMFFAEERGIDPNLLRAAWEKNLKVRENKDWLTSFGRAVSEK